MSTPSHMKRFLGAHPNIPHATCRAAYIPSSLISRVTNLVQRKLTLLGALTLKCYSEFKSLRPPSGAFMKQLFHHVLYQPNHFNCLGLYKLYVLTYRILFLLFTFQNITRIFCARTFHLLSTQLHCSDYIVAGTRPGSSEVPCNL